MRKINIEKIRVYDIHASHFIKLQNGEDFLSTDGIVIKNEMLTDDLF